LNALVSRQRVKSVPLAAIKTPEWPPADQRCRIDHVTV